jgi:hypothetical protein
MDTVMAFPHVETFAARELWISAVSDCPKRIIVPSLALHHLAFFFFISFIENGKTKPIKNMTCTHIHAHPSTSKGRSSTKKIVRWPYPGIMSVWSIYICMCKKGHMVEYLAISCPR